MLSKQVYADYSSSLISCCYPHSVDKDTEAVVPSQLTEGFRH